ncbi:MAG: AzlC family ABC transporter permease [Synechococcales cyanobacterium K44_A2020_017]|uniref:AzlC family ABC transporter permease n=1 Tax=Leptolyngbya sp. CCY15150 TaxID=2767772 RepID=UPI00194EBE8F|nr:AzlC family ABC transporter permease [Leptolyngbya sp. CCY15150]MBF2087411.1 AzlC family ABC transporter permease [Synechococcales cyanobacterium K32_A2020_035]MBF2096594.1 AzlC family ABC transporter permease [Synechococcales cyanobacterium K44_A2020_017]
MNPSSDRVPSPRHEVLSGMRGILPLVIGAVPFGIIFGTLASGSGLSAAGAMGMSIFVFAGSSQFIALGLLASGTAIPLVIVTTIVVNVRHLLYSISMMPHLRHDSLAWKLLLSFWLTDENFAVAIARYNQADSSPHKHWYSLGAGVLMYGNWLLCTGLGITLGQQIPTNLGLDFAMAVTFIGMVIPYVVTRPMGVAVGVAGSVALLAHGLPHQLGLMVASLVGILAGAIAESLQPPTVRPSSSD